MKVTVCTFKMKSGQCVSERVIDFDKPYDKTWLARHIEWAAKNHLGVQVFNSVDDKGQGR